MNSIFSDRRSGSDRRVQDLPVPAELDRRANSRRTKYFQAQPWWLRINYATPVENVAANPSSGSTSRIHNPSITGKQD